MHAKSSSSDGGVSFFRAIMLMIKSFIGLGILFLPATFYNATIKAAIPLMVAIAFLATLGMYMLGEVALIVPGSFEEIGLKLGGKKMYWFTLSCIALSQLAFSSSYMIACCNLAIGFYRQVNGESSDKNKAAEKINIYGPTVFILLFMFIGLVLIRRMKMISSLSVLATSLITTSLLIISYYFGKVWTKKEVEERANMNPSALGTLGAFGTAIFAYEGIGLVVPVLRSMSEPHRFNPALIISMVFTSFMYVSFAIFGSLTIAKKDGDGFILHELPREWPVAVVYFFYFIAIVLTWPLSMFPAIEILQKLIMRNAADESGGKNVRVKWKKNVLRITVTIIMAFFSLATFNNIGAVVDWIGILLCVPLSFIIPGMYHYLAFKTPKKRIVSISMFIFGIVALIAAAANSIHDLVKHKAPPGNLDKK